MKQTEARVLRENLKDLVMEKVVFADIDESLKHFEPLGKTSKGAVFSDGIDVVVIKAIVKREGTDIMPFIEEHEMKLKEQAEKEKEKK